jgi:AMMECR1 domain-containing protein
MPLVSRRDLISAGVTVGVGALLPTHLLASASGLPDSGAQSATVADERIEQVDKSPYSIGEQEEILKLARHALTKLFEGKTVLELQPDADRLDLPSPERLNITLRHAGRIRGSMSAPGANLGRQITESVYRAAMDRRYGGHLTRWEMPDTLLEVWIQTGSSEISPDARFEKHVLLLGIEGLEIEGHGKSAYYKPSVAITSRYKSDTALFEALCKKARLQKDAWRQTDVSVRKTQWVCVRSVSNAHFFSHELEGKTKLPITPNNCIAESASYLLRNQDADGSSAYLYDPITDLFAAKKANLVRSAGCLFGLSQILQSNHHIAAKRDFKTCTLQMARSLLSRTSLIDDGRRVVQEEKGGGLPGEEDAAGEPAEEGESARKLAQGEEKADESPEEEERSARLPAVGATALLAAALSGDVLRREFAQEYQQLYRSIASAQKQDGRFVTHFGETAESERVANYYSGEALLLLALEAERGNTEALEMCKRAFQPYVLHFRKGPTTAFVGWHVNVWSRIALLSGDHAYADFAFEQTDWLLQKQINSHHDSRWLGGFSQTDAAPQFSSIVFLEATVRALMLAIKIRDAERMRKYANSVHSGLRFCKQLRLEETPATLLANPMRCKGGVALGLIDRRVRCDAVQHFITLCLAVEQIRHYLV